MATLYVSSVDGDNASPPSEAWWNGNQNTYESVQGALSAATDADNTIYVDSHHDFEGAGITWNLPGDNSVRIISVDRVSGLWTPGARETIDTSVTFTIGGAVGNYYIYGIYFDTTEGYGSSKHFSIATVVNNVVLEKCTLRCRSNNATHTMMVGASSGTTSSRSNAILRNCNVIAHDSDSNAVITCRQSNVLCVNLSVSYSGAGRPPALFRPGWSASIGWRSSVQCVDSDLSAFVGDILLFDNNFYFGELSLQNCKLNPAATMISGEFPDNNGEVTVINCSAGNTTNVYEYHKDNGTLVEDETVYYKGTKYADGSNISWAVVPNNKATAYNPFYTPWISAWNNTVDSAVTAKIKLLTEESELTDTQLWVEFEYLADANSPLGTLYSTRNNNPFGDGDDLSNVAAGSAWEATPLTTPREYILSHTFTPKRKGLIRARVGMLAAAEPCNINPKIEL